MLPDTQLKKQTKWIFLPDHNKMLIIHNLITYPCQHICSEMVMLRYHAKEIHNQ